MNALNIPDAPLVKGSVTGKELARTGFSVGRRTVVTSLGTATSTQAAAMTLINQVNVVRSVLIFQSDSGPIIAMSSTTPTSTMANTSTYFKQTSSSARVILIKSYIHSSEFVGKSVKDWTSVLIAWNQPDYN